MHKKTDFCCSKCILTFFAKRSNILLAMIGSGKEIRTSESRCMVQNGVRFFTKSPLSMSSIVTDR